jgi:hypothetical protein
LDKKIDDIAYGYHKNNSTKFKLSSHCLVKNIYLIMYFDLNGNVECVITYLCNRIPYNLLVEETVELCSWPICLHRRWLRLTFEVTFLLAVLIQLKKFTFTEYSLNCPLFCYIIHDYVDFQKSCWTYVQKSARHETTNSIL